jgi:exonuclease SbcC
VDTSEQKALKVRIGNELDEIKRQLAIKSTIEQTQTRISQLQKEEAANAQAIADIERSEFEIETYTRAKMDILEKRVNEKFRYVQFRLFDTQVNGAVVEDCMCYYGNVKYPTLNTAAKLLAGLDVLETLSNHYDVHAPVFCDNRESVSWIPESKSQIISLFVSAADVELRVECQAQTAQAA